MITTGIIRQINISEGSFVNNKYLVELNIFQIPGDMNVNNYTYKANCSILSGFYDIYKVGDKVYVGFLNNATNNPIILGKIYQGCTDNYAAAAFLNQLNVKENCTLPENTKIGNINVRLLLKTISSLQLELENTKNKVEELSNEITEIKNSLKG